MRNYGFMALFITLLLLILSVQNRAQEIAAASPTAMLQDTKISTAAIPDSGKAQDSFESGGFEDAPKPELLPANISIAERFFWGESGLTRKIGLASEISPESRKYEIKVRRTMLSIHQVTGFATVAMMLGACYYGQKTIDAGGDKKFGDVHSALIGTTILTYSLTAALAILTPPPLVRRDDGGTTTWHKALAWGHVIGMIVTPILAANIKERGPNHPQGFDAKNAHVHQLGGYITTALFTSAMIVISL